VYILGVIIVYKDISVPYYRIKLVITIVTRNRIAIRNLIYNVIKLLIYLIL